MIENMKKLGLEYIQGHQHEKVIKSADGEGFTVVMKNGDTHSAEKVLLAMGRPQNVSGLCLENTKIETDHGAIKIDAYQNTTVPGVYAIGDVTKNL